MSKSCLVCKTINYSAANHCSVCGNELSDKELSEEEKLHIELHEAKMTIHGLNKALAEMQKNAGTSEEAQKIIAEYKAKLTKEKQETSKYASLIYEKDKDLTYVSKQMKNIKRRRNIWVILLLIICIFLGISLIELNKEIEKKKYSNSSLDEKSSFLETENSSLKQKVSSLEKDKGNLNDIIDSISTYYPIIIKSLKVGNTYKDGTIETDFGNTLYSYNSMFLMPRIEYVGLNNTSITLLLKLYKDGVLSLGATSLDGYSYDSNINVTYEGVASLSAWGSETKGNWSAGNYRYEIWYNNICLKTLNFTLY